MLQTNIYQEDIINDLISVNTDKPLSAAQGKILYDLVVAAATVPTGIIFPYSGLVAPAGYLFTDGSALNRTTYTNLFNVVTSDKGAFTVTIASPGVFTLNAHGLLTGDCISLSTTGALPTGLAVATNYYVIFVSANTFNLATTFANAIAASPTRINTSGAQSGVHTLLYNPWGISGATDFLLPDSRAASDRGVGTSTKFTANKTIGLGHYGDDNFQNITGLFKDAYVRATSGDTGAFSRGTTTIATINGTSGGRYGDILFNAANSSGARTSDETAGKSFGTNFIIKW